MIKWISEEALEPKCLSNVNDPVTAAKFCRKFAIVLSSARGLMMAVVLDIALQHDESPQTACMPRGLRATCGNA